jgi:putative tryptophan/tyrosine transport system substrate-binding protein
VNRRRALLAMAASFASASTRAQATMRRVGFLYFGSRESALATGRHPSFLGGMRTLGYVAGRDFALEERFADGKREVLRAQAEELARQKLDAVVVAGSPAVSEMRRASATLPIVVAIMGGDPVRDGYAATLARPGGNVTGVYTSNAELLAIQIELLAKVAPSVKLIAAISNPSNPVHPGLMGVVQAAARKAGAQVIVVKSSTPAQIDEAFEEMKRAGAGGLVVLGDTFFTQQSRQLASLALQNRLPMISTTREYVDAGGLFSYGEDARENFRLAAGYVDKILRGARPGDLAFSRSQRPYLVVNRKTFSILGLSVPQELAVRADEVIQ